MVAIGKVHRLFRDAGLRGDGFHARARVAVAQEQRLAPRPGSPCGWPQPADRALASSNAGSTSTKPTIPVASTHISGLTGDRPHHYSTTVAIIAAIRTSVRSNRRLTTTIPNKAPTTSSGVHAERLDRPTPTEAPGAHVRSTTARDRLDAHKRRRRVEVASCHRRTRGGRPDRPTSPWVVEELAAACGADPDGLDRVLRLLAAFGIFEGALRATGTPRPPGFCVATTRCPCAPSRR